VELDLTSLRIFLAVVREGSIIHVKRQAYARFERRLKGQVLFFNGPVVNFV
jgi:hypothetical protein